MNVRVIIASRPDGSFHVSVLAPKIKRSWRKKYISRQACLDDLISAGLLTHAEKAEAQASNLDNKDHIFVVHTEAEPEVLRAAGFVEQKKEYVH